VIAEACTFSPALKTSLALSFTEKDRWQKLRHQTWAESALATITNTHSAKQICTAWSATAHLILREAFTTYFSDVPAALFALGKLGSDELNLSSDVDLLIVIREEGEAPVKALRHFQKVLSERGPFGFIFRTDFDLRPGGRQGPVLPTVDHFVDYYGNFGETWERMAFVRLTPIAGDAGIITEIKDFAKKFTFRKHLDYTLLDDLKSLRGRLRQHYSGRSTDETVDLKLGVGGIRDVELFTHALQVIHGGKNPSLQTCATEESLRRLGAAKLLPTADVDFLIGHYWRLRHLENLVQARNDEQTHLLVRTDTFPEWARPLIDRLKENCKACDLIVGSLLGTLDAEPSHALPMSTAAEEIWAEILSLEVHSRNKERDEEARRLFLQQFYETLLRQKGQIEKALFHLRDFIKSTRAKASFFTLLVRNKGLLDEIAWLFGHSPYLSQILSSRPELIDSFVYRSQDLQKDDLAILLEQLVEKRLLSELINGSHFLEDRDVRTLQKNLTETADEICHTLFDELKKEFPSEMNILCLGKWGGQELGLRSDLDFILVTPAEPQENDTKLARRFINRLTELRKGGSIFAVDMRLKPSGKAGPMVISYSQLEHYLKNDAETWEHQAYLKARWLTASTWPIQTLFIQHGLSQTQKEKLEGIRRELLQMEEDAIDIKYAEGGLLDIELFAQTVVLEKKWTPLGPSTPDFLSQIEDSAVLTTSYIRLRQIEQMWQLLSSEGGSRLNLKNESFQQLARSFQSEPAEFTAHLQGLLRDNSALLNALDPRRQTKILTSL
jgi:glutamate-ammonia-ligase adenylyltransferase